MENIIKNLKNDALSRNLIKRIKKYFIKNLIKNFKNGDLSRNLIKRIKKYFIKNLIKNLKNGDLSRNLIKRIKKCFIKNLIKNLKKAPYHVQKSTLSKNTLSRSWNCLIIKRKKVPYQKPLSEIMKVPHHV